MKVIVGCEESQIITKAFREKGHEAYSCDIQPCSGGHPEWHIQDNIFHVLHSSLGFCIDLFIAHPPCTYLANSGVHLLKKQSGRWGKMEEGAIFFRSLLHSNIPKICIENPVIHKYAMEIIGKKYNQTIQPWQFGEDASKRTCLWLKGLPPLIHTRIIKKKRYANQTSSGQNKLGPSKDRAKLRAKTYQGIANAMANQWG